MLGRSKQRILKSGYTGRKNVKFIGGKNYSRTYLVSLERETDISQVSKILVFTDSESLLNCMTLFEMKETNLLTYFTKLTRKSMK